MGSPLYGASEISVPFLIKTKDFESTFRHIEVYFPELTNSDNEIGQYFVQKRLVGCKKCLFYFFHCSTSIINYIPTRKTFFGEPIFCLVNTMADNF